MAEWEIRHPDTRDTLMTVLIGNCDILGFNNINDSLRIIWWTTMKNSFCWLANEILIDYMNILFIRWER